MNLELFLSGEFPHNTWIKERNIAIYIRKSVRLIGEKTYPCLDIGSVEVNEKHRGQGIFTSFLKRFEQEAKKLNRGVFVENIFNKRLLQHLLSHGYALVPRTSEITPCVFNLLA